MTAPFIVVGDQGGAMFICGHICFFAVEVAGCVVVAAVGAGSAAGGVGGPISATVWEVRGLSGLTAKARGAG